MSCCEVNLSFVVTETNTLSVTHTADNNLTSSLDGDTNVNITLSQQNTVEVTNEIPNVVIESIGTIELEYGTKYFGNPGSDGSWRMRISAGDLVVEKRESGVWVEKGAYF